MPSVSEGPALRPHYSYITSTVPTITIPSVSERSAIRLLHNTSGIPHSAWTLDASRQEGRPTLRLCLHALASYVYCLLVIPLEILICVLACHVPAREDIGEPTTNCISASCIFSFLNRNPSTCLSLAFRYALSLCFIAPTLDYDKRIVGS